MGYEPNIESIWAAHHALILPSRGEGLPLALVEAMWCGRPAIVTDSGGNAEIVEEGVTGFVADWPNTKAINDALERAWQRRGAWCEMGMAAAEEIRKRLPDDPVGKFCDNLLSLI
jgi:glycosyltransferase involved in cell wall biosynthesis